jgi:5-hydroxyisourate hydrolase-like protein (transthyretin family)
MRAKSMLMLPVLLLALIFVNQTILTSGEDSNAEKDGSISGKIIEKDSKKPIANIKLQLTIHIPGEHTRRKETKTDEKGRYRFENLRPGKYRIEIIPTHPYCYRRKGKINDNKVIILERNENIVCDGVLEIGGSVTG